MFNRNKKTKAPQQPARPYDPSVPATLRHRGTDTTARQFAFFYLQALKRSASVDAVKQAARNTELAWYTYGGLRKASLIDIELLLQDNFKYNTGLGLEYYELSSDGYKARALAVGEGRFPSVSVWRLKDDYLSDPKFDKFYFCGINLKIEEYNPMYKSYEVL